MHEAQLHENNCFITLTFNDKHLNKKGSLVKKDFQLFLKRLRKHFAPLVYVSCEPSIKRPWLFKMEKIYKPYDLRYFHCGEYGKEKERPHHHALLFNMDFADKVRMKCKNKLYRSETLEYLWSDPDTHESYGFSSIGSVSYASACYVAQYCLKKVSGDLAPGHYQGRLPEYTSSSKKPAIGLEWMKKYHSTDLYPRDYTVVNGVKGKIPKYYDRAVVKYGLTTKTEMDKLKDVRIQKAKLNPGNTPERLLDAEQIRKSKHALYKNRSL